MRQIGFIAGTDGTVAKWEPPQAPVYIEPLVAFREALTHLDSFFKELGLRPHTDGVERSISYEFARDCHLDISIHDPARVAYVTSHVGYRYEKKAAMVTPDIRLPGGKRVRGQTLYEVSATVKFLGEVMRGEHVFQLVLSKRGHTDMPVYVELPPNTQDPVSFLIRSLLGTIRMMAMSTPEIKQTFEQRFLDQSTVNDNPGSEPINV